MPHPLHYTIAGVPLQVFSGHVDHHLTLNAARAAEAVRTVAATTPNLKIIVLPAYVLSGGFGDVAASCEDAPLDDMKAAAVELGVYIAASDRFGGGHTGFIIDPSGEIALTQTLVSDQMVSEQKDAFEFAVLATPHGDLACLPKDDVTHPEYVRACLFKGAEIILNPTIEITNHRANARHMSRGARCWESIVVMASAALSGVVDDADQLIPGEPINGLAEIWNHSGALMASSTNSPASAVADILSLRTRRSEPWINFPAQLRTELYAKAYEQVAATPVAAPSEDDAVTAPVYDVLLMQTHERFATGPHDRDEAIAENMARGLGLARMFAARPTTRLVIFPEFFLQGSTPGDLDYWEKMGIRVPGPETDTLAAFAKETGVYLCGAVLEYDPEWPRRYFNTSIIISPEGEIILRYRKLQCADLNGLLNITTPGNIYSAYVDRYGFDALIPVVDTEIGILGTAICFDSNWPELWRIMALKGAEVICNPTSEIHSERVPAWWSAKRAHAAENMTYVACANAGSEQFAPGMPITGMNRGHSSLIDFNGNLATYADGPGIIPQVGRIDLGALRRARASVHENALARFKPEAIVQAYKDYPGFPLDCFLETPMELGREGPALVKAHIERLREAGILKPALRKSR
ncbi:MAG: nitrilase-related carbon-nitrogen hydrolase [Rhodospirillaceae bacterium]